MSTLAGVGFGVIAAVCLAGQPLVVRLGTRDGNSNNTVMVVMIVKLLILVPVALNLNPTPTLTQLSILSFIAAGVCGTFLGRALFFAGIKSGGKSV